LLAGSVKLSAGDSELVARLSDLSGTLQSDVRFYPYLTVYPLPSGAYYAIARTWLDKDAPRSGCVLTRTALVAMPDWQAGNISLSDVLTGLSPPKRDDMSIIQRPLTIERGLSRPSDTPVPVWEIEAFVAKYFGEGIRPIVWFKDADANHVLVSISRVLWPQLRRRFAACTLSLQPRNLADAPFDLLFAPTAVYSRFSKVARENLIESSNLGKPRQGSEEWMGELAQLISGSKPLPVSDDWPDLSKALSSEPTSIRWLYLLNDLRARTQQSPTAALGAMDVVERLCPEPVSEAELKGSVAESALLAADQIKDARQALSFLQLVCERLSHSPYSEISQRVLEDLRRRVGKWGHESLDQALASYEELLGRTSPLDRARLSFRNGLIDGIKRLGETGSPELGALHRFDGAAADVVPLHSAIGRSYLKLPASGDFQPSRDLARWLQNSSTDVDWSDWALMLGSFEDDAVDDQLFGECLTRLSGKDVSLFLSNVQDVKWGGSLASAIEKYLIPAESLPVRRWAFTSGLKSPAAARLCSSTFELSSDGIVDLLNYEAADQAAKNAVLVQLLARLPYGHLPRWLVETFNRRPEVIVDLINAAIVNVDRAVEVTSRTLRELDLLPSEAVDLLLPIVAGMGSSPIAEDLCPLLVRTIFVWALRSVGYSGKLKQIDEIPVLSAWMTDADGSRLANVFGGEIARNKDSYGRAWLVLAESPEALYRSRRLATITVISQLLRQSSVNWSHESSSSWRVILKRANAICEPRYYVRHCVQALGFSLANSRLPVSAVVRSAFPDVYKAVVEQAPYEDEANSLLSYDWDRAKALRRNLVDCFYQSNWPEGDLALTAAESFGLRKLFRRVWRKWSGEEYVARMIADLRRRNEPLAIQCLNELISYYEKPNFNEPWD